MLVKQVFSIREDTAPTGLLRYRVLSVRSLERPKKARIVSNKEAQIFSALTENDPSQVPDIETSQTCSNSERFGQEFLVCSHCIH